MDSRSAHVLELHIGKVSVRSPVGRSRLERAVAELFVNLRAPVYRYVLSIVHEPAEAEDATQEAFLKLFSALRRGENVNNAAGWVFRVAHHLAIDRRRQNGHMERMDPEALDRLASAAPATPEEATAERERQRALASALPSLSPQERRCLNLRAEGLRYREIAKTLRVSISSVETFLARAVKKLSEKIS